jgi:hypothetical protein
MSLVFLFDRVKYALTLRVHGERQSKGELHDHLKTAAGMVKGVFRQFKGLVGEVPAKFQFTDAHDDTNTKVTFIECCDNPSSRNISDNARLHLPNATARRVHRRAAARDR